MTEVLSKTRRDIAERLRELRPFVEEYQRLEEAVSALAGIVAASRPRPTAPRRRTPRRPRGTTTPKMPANRASKPKPAVETTSAAKHDTGRPRGRGARAAQALAIVRANPGITIPEIAAQMAIKGNYLYQVLPKLEREGKVLRRGRGWEPNGP